MADHERGEERRSSVNRGESPEIGSHSILVSFFSSLSLSPSSDSLCHPSSPLRARFESRPSSKRNKLNLAGFQRSWRNSSNRPTRFSSRVRIFSAPNLDHSVFFFWEKILLEAVPCCGNVDRFFARRRDSSSLFLEKKTTIITKLIANRWIERLARIIRSSPLPSIELPSMFICSTSAFDGSLLFPFSFFFFYEFLL